MNKYIYSLNDWWKCLCSVAEYNSFSKYIVAIHHQVIVLGVENKNKIEWTLVIVINQ